MITPHPSIDEAALRQLLRVESLEFLPVGGDSWSYRAGERFVNVRDSRGHRKPYTRPRDVLGSITAAIALRDRCGLEFLLTPDHTAQLGTWIVTVFPFLVGEMSWEVDRPDIRERVRTWVDRLHDASPAIDDLPLASETFDAEYAGALTNAIDRAGRATDGPYADRLAVTLATERRQILSALEAHLSHGAALRARDLPFVVTHGEPGGNVLILPDDSAFLIDLVDLRRAPKERDLVEIDAADPDVDIVDYYRQDYALSEITEYADRLSQPHTGDAEDERAWNELGVFIGALR